MTEITLVAVVLVVAWLLLDAAARVVGGR